MLLLCAGGR